MLQFPPPVEKTIIFGRTATICIWWELKILQKTSVHSHTLNIEHRTLTSLIIWRRLFTQLFAPNVKLFPLLQFHRLTNGYHWKPLNWIEYNCTDKNHWPLQKIITLVGVLMELSDPTTNKLTILKNVNESCSGLLVSPGGSAIISPHNLTFTTNSPEQVVVNIWAILLIIFLCPFSTWSAW